MDRRGRLIADLWVLAGSEGCTIRVREDRIAPFFAQLERHRFSERVAWRALGPDDSPLLLVGPEAPAVMARLGADPREGARDGGWCEGAFWLRVRETGAAEYLLFPGAGTAARWEERAEGAGATRIGWQAFHLARMERGVPWYGLEIDEDRLLPEAGLEDRIHRDKGCYLGQEVLARLHYRGQVARRLVRMTGPSAPPDVGSPLVDAAGEEQGQIASASAHHAGGFSAMGYVHRRALEAGDPLRLADQGNVEIGGPVLPPLPPPPPAPPPPPSNRELP